MPSKFCIQDLRWSGTKLTVVSGACRRYFRCLLQLLLSLNRHGYTRCIVYDLGFSEWQMYFLLKLFPWVDLRPLPAGPDHLVDISNYAWKPTAIAEVVGEVVGPVLWLDSACVVTGSLAPVVEHVNEHGIWVPWAGRGKLGDRTHPKTLFSLKVEPEIQKGRFRAGGVCAFHPSHAEATELVKQWRELAWELEVLAPAGSNRDNHRYDQALLSVLLARSPRLQPSRDEIDISSSHPVGFLRTRNKIASGWPLLLDLPLRAYFALFRQLDILLWKWRDRRWRSDLPLEPSPGF